MGQMTLRAPDDVLARVRAQARHEGRSMNDWVVTILAAVTDPATASSPAARVRERLRSAGLLQESVGAPSPPAAVDVARARAAFGPGAPLSDYLVDDRA